MNFDFSFLDTSHAELFTHKRDLGVISKFGHYLEDGFHVSVLCLMLRQ